MRKQARHLPAFLLLQLVDGPLHGGALQSGLNTNLPDLNADSGAVYRALMRMEKDGEVKSHWDTTPPGPARRIYSITPAGFERLGVWNSDMTSCHGCLSYFIEAYAKLPKRSVSRPPRAKH